jgi:hypothetical protein
MKRLRVSLPVCWILHSMVHLLQQWTVVIVDGVHLAQHHIVFSEQHMQDVQRNHWQLIAGTWDSHSTAIKGIKNPIPSKASHPWSD